MEHSENKLKDTREYFGYSLGDMADKVGISKTFYWHLENGTRRMSYEKAHKISKILKCKPDDLFYEQYDKKGDINV